MGKETTENNLISHISDSDTATNRQINVYTNVLYDIEIVIDDNINITYHIVFYVDN